jgi:hypothetical protein
LGFKEVWGTIICKEDRDKANKRIKYLKVGFDDITWKNRGGK